MKRFSKDALNPVDRRTALIAGLASASLISSTAPLHRRSTQILRKQGCVNWGLNCRRSRHRFKLCPLGAARQLNLPCRNGPRNPDGTRPQGKVGRDVTLDQADLHARNVGMQLLAAMREAAGSLDRVVRIGRVFGMVNAAPKLPTIQRSSMAARTYSYRCSAIAVGMHVVPWEWACSPSI